MAILIAPAAPSVRFATKTLTFTGADTLGLVNTNASLFTVTGDVVVFLISPFCTSTLTGAASTVQLGVLNGLTIFIGVSTATLIATGQYWVNTTPASTDNAIAFPAALKEIAITDSIVCRSLTQTTTGGTLRFDVFWQPLSSDGNLVAA